MFQLPPLPRNLEASFRDLGSQKPEVRASAVADVARHAALDSSLAERAKVALRKALSDEAPPVRGAAAVALADLEDEGALPQLLLLVEDDHGYVRQMALTALGEIGDLRAKARVLRAISDERPDVRYQAIIAFARLETDPDEKALVLFRALADDDVAVVHIALRVIEEQLANGVAVDASRATALETLLASPSSNVRVAAAIVLGRASLRDPETRPLASTAKKVLVAAASGEPLGDRLEREDEQGAIELVGELGFTEVVPALERRVFGLSRFVRDTSAFHARIALARMGHLRARSAIREDLEARGDRRIAGVVSCGRAALHDERPRLLALATNAEEPLRTHVQEALAELDAAPRKDPPS